MMPLNKGIFGVQNSRRGFYHSRRQPRLIAAASMRHFLLLWIYRFAPPSYSKLK
jgi:hypothetical protein